MFAVAGMEEIREAVGAYAAGFDPALVSAAEAQRIVSEAVAAENMLATVRGLAARRVSETELWRRQGDRSPAHHLARVTGSSVSKAQETLDTAGRLGSLPHVEAAARRGELSPSQAAPIATAGGSVGQPASDKGADDACGPDGLEEPATGGCELFPALAPQPTPPAPAPRAGPPGEGPPRPPSPMKMIVRIDLDTLLRGFPLDGELCEVSGLGPVPVAAVRTMMATGNVFLAAVATRGVDVVGVAHLGRRPTAHQQTALEWLSPQCTNTACDAVFGLENDHRVPWADTKVTLVGCMDPLCRHCHGLKTHKGWALVGGAGRRPLVPPQDPRHPGEA